VSKSGAVDVAVGALRRSLGTDVVFAALLPVVAVHCAVGIMGSAGVALSIFRGRVDESLLLGALVAGLGGGIAVAWWLASSWPPRVSASRVGLSVCVAVAIFGVSSRVFPFSVIDERGFTREELMQAALRFGVACACSWLASLAALRWPSRGSQHGAKVRQQWRMGRRTMRSS
jgi:hypothetical protein